MRLLFDHFESGGYEEVSRDQSLPSKEILVVNEENKDYLFMLIKYEYSLYDFCLHLWP